MKDPLMQCTNCGRDIIEECECDHPQVNLAAPKSQQRPEVARLVRPKYRITWTDYTRTGRGEIKRMTVYAMNLRMALLKFYARHPNGRCPSVSLA